MPLHAVAPRRRGCGGATVGRWIPRTTGRLTGPQVGTGPSAGPAPARRGFLPPEPPRGGARFLPLLEQLRGYHSLRPDLVAGVMVAALALPQAMAYAQIAGLPVVAGLYGLLLPVIAYAFLGSSRVLMTGPTTTAALMVGPALLAVSDDPGSYPVLAAMLALLVGLVFLLGRLAHLGWLADYFSTAVLLGFVTGLALTMIAGQVGVLLGVGVTGDTPMQQYVSFLGGVVGGAHGPTVAIGLISLVLLVVAGRWVPAFPMLLVLTVVSIVLSGSLDLAARGVAVVGDIPAGLPRLSWPAVGLDDVVALVPAAVGIALVGFSDAILLARSLARRGEVVDADQELLALAGLNAALGSPGRSPWAPAAVAVP